MATLDRQLPSLDTFLCKPWSIFTEAAKLHYIDNNVTLFENNGKQLLNNREAMKLNKEDMHLYGQFPTHEDFSLVVCNVCNQVVKPQGFLTHYERRHGSPSSSRGLLVPMKPKVSLSHSAVEALPFRVPRDYPHSRFNKAPLAVYPPKGARAKACVSLPVVSLEKIPCFGRVDAAHIKINSASGTSFSFSSSSFSSSSLSSSPSPAPSLKSSPTSQASHKSQEKLLNGRGPTTPRSATSPSSLDGRPSPSPSSQDRRPVASPSPSSSDRRANTLSSPLDRKHQNGTKAGRHKRVSGRVFDPNKHCGVLDPESKRSCTRSLTCKTHSLTHRRAVPGRKKEFDVLLAEHKGRAKEKEVGHKSEAPTGSQSALSYDATPSVPVNCHNGRIASALKLRLANAHIHRAAVLSSTSVPTPDPVPSWQRAAWDGRLSSDEGDAEILEDSEKLACHYSPQHPRPMSCCTFSSRLMGRGHYVFDRRWDRMRLALHCMVEKHVNSQMWKKVPLAAESLGSGTPSPSDPSTTGSGVLSSPLLPSPGFSPSLDGVSVVSYSTAFPHNGAGVFCIRDPDAPPKPSKPGKPPRTPGEGAGARKRKPPPLASDCVSYRRNGNGYQPPGPALIGAATLSVKVQPSGRAGQGLRDSDRYTGAELTAPHALTGDHGLSSHSPLPLGATDARKRKSSGSGDRPGKMTKAAGLDSIFRKSLLAAVPESPHNALPRQPKVYH